MICCSNNKHLLHLPYGVKVSRLEERGREERCEVCSQMGLGVQEAQSMRKKQPPLGRGPGTSLGFGAP